MAPLGRVIVMLAVPKFVVTVPEEFTAMPTYGGMEAPVAPVPHHVLFPGKATRLKDEEAAGLNGRTVRLEQLVRQGQVRERVVREGVLRFRGAHQRPSYFLVEWGDGGSGSEAITLQQAKAWLVPESRPAQRKEKSPGRGARGKR